MSRIAIAVWQGNVSITLDFAGSLLIVDIERGAETGRDEIALGRASPQEIVRRLVELQVSVVICGAVSGWLAHSLQMRGMRLIPFVSGEVDAVVQAYSSGTLGDRTFLMAGCQPGARRAWRCRRRRGSPGRT